MPTTDYPCSVPVAVRTLRSVSDPACRAFFLALPVRGLDRRGEPLRRSRPDVGLSCRRFVRQPLCDRGQRSGSSNLCETVGMSTVLYALFNTGAIKRESWQKSPGPQLDELLSSMVPQCALAPKVRNPTEAVSGMEKPVTIGCCVRLGEKSRSSDGCLRRSREANSLEVL